MDRVWYKFYDKGVPHSIDYPGKAMKDYFNEWADKNPSKPYLIWGDQQLTYAGNKLARQTANAILTLNYKGDDRSDEYFEYVILLQPAIKLSRHVLPTLYHSWLTPFSDSETTIVFVEDRFANKVAEHENGTTLIKTMIVLNSHTGAPRYC